MMSIPFGLVCCSLLTNCVVQIKRFNWWLELATEHFRMPAEKEDCGSRRIFSDRRKRRVTARDNLMEAAIF